MNQIPSICIGECYICLQKMYFEDHAKIQNQRMQWTCGDVKHQICYGCFCKLEKNECPMCRKQLLKPPPQFLYNNLKEYQIRQLALLSQMLEQFGYLNFND